MVDSVDFSIIGLESLSAKLKSIDQDLKKKGGRSALRKAANLVRDAAKNNALSVDDPSSRENIVANLAVRWSSRRFKRTGDLMFRVGIMGGAGGSKSSEALSTLPGGDTRHWRFIEFGTQKMPATPFFRKALANNINQATGEFIKQYEKSIDRAIKRAKKTSK